MGIWIRKVPWNSSVHLPGQRQHTSLWHTQDFTKDTSQNAPEKEKQGAQSLFNSKECTRQGTQMVRYRQVGATAESLTPFGQCYIHWCSSLSVWSHILWATEICWDPSEKAKKQQQTELPENPAQCGEVWDQTLDSKNFKNRKTQAFKELGQDF